MRRRETTSSGFDVRRLAVMAAALLLLAAPAAAQEYDEIGGDDVLVTTDNYLLPSPSMDIAENGDIYVAVARAAVAGVSGPEIRVYRSQDAGDTFPLWGTITLALALAQAIDDPCVHIGEGTQSRIYVAYRYRGPSDANYSINVAFSELNLTSAVWVQRSAVSQQGIDFQAPSLHSDEMSNADYRLYLAAMGSGSNGGDVWFSRSTTFGDTWEAEYEIFSNTTSDQMAYPEIRYGRNGVVHCVCYYNPTGSPAHDMAARYRRALNYAAVGNWQPVVDLTSEANGSDEFHVSVAASHASDRVVIGYALRNSAGEFQPARYRWSTDAGATWPLENANSTADNHLPHLLANDPQGRVWAWGNLSGTDNFGVNYFLNTLTFWSPHWSHMDRPYSVVPNTRTGSQYFDLNVAKSGRLGWTWMTWSAGGADSVFFDAGWRTDPGYPNIEPGFPIGLASGVVAPPAVCELDGDPESEIVFGTADGNIHVYNHDGTVVPGWPVDIGSFHADATIAVGSITGNSDNEVVAGNSTGTVYAFTAAGTPLAGWPITLVAGSPAYLAIGAISTPERQVVTCCGNRVHLINGDGSIAPGFPMQPNTPVSCPPALGDVDADGDRDIVILQQNIMNVLTGQGTVQAVRGFAGDGKTFSNAPTLADIDLDGDLEIAASTDQGDLYLLYGDGSDFPGWPYHDASGVRLTSAALANIRGLFEPEIIFNQEGPTAAAVHALSYWGSELSGYPRTPVAGWYLWGMPIADCLDEGSTDVVVATRDQNGYAFTNFGVDLPGWPKFFGAQFNVSPASGDLDSDNRLEVVFTSYSPPGFFIVDVGAAPYRSEMNPDNWWPMYGYNPMRQGCLACDNDRVAGVTGEAPPVGPIVFAAPSPNPASGPVRLEFQLPEAAGVRLDLYDVRGRLVRRMLKEEMEPGPHAVTWDGTVDGQRAPAGVYFARLQVSGATETRQIHRKVVIQ